MEGQWLVPWETTSIRDLFAALLAADRPLSVSEWAEEADVARSTIYRNNDVWAGIDLLRETDDGYRLALSFREVERYEDLWPWFVDDAEDLFATMPDIVDPILEELYPPDDYLQLTELLYPPDGPPDLDALREAAPVLSRWPERLQVALGECCPEQLTVFGEADPSQTSIRDPASTSAPAAD